MQQTSVKVYKTRHDWVREGDPLRIVQEIKIWSYNQMVYAQNRIRPREWDVQSSLGFKDTNRSPNPGYKTRPCDI